jgi:hypothetical protein
MRISASPLPRRALVAVAAGLLALAAAATAEARPVITGFGVTPDRGAPACGESANCLRFTFRAFDASRARDSKLTFRLVVTRKKDGVRKLNATGTFANSETLQRYWVRPKTAFTDGTYTARLIVTGADSTKSPLRTFSWDI